MKHNSQFTYCTMVNKLFFLFLYITTGSPIYERVLFWERIQKSDLLLSPTKEPLHFLAVPSMPPLLFLLLPDIRALTEHCTSVHYCTVWWAHSHMTMTMSRRLLSSFHDLFASMNVHNARSFHYLWKFSTQMFVSRGLTVFSSF